jgi:hypothetical protein
LQLGAKRLVKMRNANAGFYQSELTTMSPPKRGKFSAHRSYHYERC